MENITTIKWNDRTKEEIKELHKDVENLLMKGFLNDKNGIGHPDNHRVVQQAILKRFPCAKHKPNMYAVYVALACDLSDTTCWEDMLEQFNIREMFDTRGDGEVETLTCICGQLVGSTFQMKNGITDEILHVGSTCTDKMCITEYQQDEYKKMKSKLAKKKRELATERRLKKEEAQRAKEEEEYKLANFHCCRKCKQYVIPKGTFTSTTCYECRIFKEGYKKCCCCGLYKLKNDSNYNKCFTCNTSKKKSN